MGRRAVESTFQDFWGSTEETDGSVVGKYGEVVQKCVCGVCVCVCVCVEGQAMVNDFIISSCDFIFYLFIFFFFLVTLCGLWVPFNPHPRQ